MRISLVLFLVLVFGLTACFKFENPYPTIAPGQWRGVLKLNPVFISPNPKGKPLPEKLNIQFEELSGGELPFNFEIKYVDENDLQVILRNGEEVIVLDEVEVGHNITNGQDTILIKFPVFETEIRAVFEANIMEGKWIATNRQLNGTLPYEVKFVARHGQNHRFTTLKKEPFMDLSGRWATTFGVDKEQPYAGIGDFVQEGNHLTGTFLTETGDHRFLEGTVQANKIYLSAFDGSHAFLYEGKLNPDSTIIGAFYSGIHYKTIWEASRDPNASLVPADQLTRLNTPEEPIDFKFENQDGQMVALSDSTYQGKVKLVELMGTWCPNCRDAAPFLHALSQQFSKDDFAIIGLAFERQSKPEKAKKAIRRYKENLGVDYEILLASTSDDKEIATKQMPMLAKVKAYPTFMVVNQQNQVVKTFTGIYGPATREYQSFTDKIVAAINEQFLPE